MAPSPTLSGSCQCRQAATFTPRSAATVSTAATTAAGRSVWTKWPLSTTTSCPFGDNAAGTLLDVAPERLALGRIAMIGRRNDKQRDGWERRTRQECGNGRGNTRLFGSFDTAGFRRQCCYKSTWRLERTCRVNEHDARDHLRMVAGEGLHIEPADGMADQDVGPRQAMDAKPGDEIGCNVRREHGGHGMPRRQAPVDAGAVVGHGGEAGVSARTTDAQFPCATPLPASNTATGPCPMICITTRGGSRATAAAASRRKTSAVALRTPIRGRTVMGVGAMGVPLGRSDSMQASGEAIMAYASPARFGGLIASGTRPAPDQRPFLRARFAAKRDCPRGQARSSSPVAIAPWHSPG